MNIPALNDLTRGYTRKFICEQMGWSYPTCNHKLNGSSDFTIGEAKKFCNVFGVTNDKDKLSLFFAD